MGRAIIVDGSLRAEGQEVVEGEVGGLKGFERGSCCGREDSLEGMESRVCL